MTTSTAQEPARRRPRWKSLADLRLMVFQIRAENWTLRSILIAKRFETQWLRWRLGYLVSRGWRRLYASPDPDRIQIHPLDGTRTYLAIMRRNREVGRWN